MLKRIALLVAIAALTFVKPSNSVAQDWGGWGGGVTVNVGFPFPHRDSCCERRFFPRRVFCCEERREFCCEERRFFPRRVDCCEERQFFPRRIDCCEERRFFPRRIDCCEERRFFPRRVDCCEERRFFPRPFRRDDWNAGYTDAGYGYNEY
jgi:hypothetical protein